MLFTVLYEIQYLVLRTLVQVEVYNDLLEQFGTLSHQILRNIVMAYIIIDNVCWELPLRKFASKNEHL